MGMRPFLQGLTVCQYIWRIFCDPQCSCAQAELCAGRLAEQRAELCADHERDRDQRDQLDQLQLQLREECAVAGRREEQNRYLHEICQQLTEMEVRFVEKGLVV